MLLLLLIAAAPSAVAADAPRLLTEEELPHASVKQLSVAQLRHEATRVENLPNLGAGASLIALGAVSALVGVLLVFVNYQNVGPSGAWLGGAEGALGLILGLAGVVMGSVGGVVLPFQMVHRSDVARRKLEVSTQLASVESGEASAPEYPSAEAVQRLLKLEETRPGFGGPTALAVAGLPLLILGLYSLSGFSGPRLPGADGWAVALTFGILGSGLTMVGFGLYGLVSRFMEKAEFNQRVRELIDAT